jgi:HD-GYP domain-containing protein (c-di-GMP phosphodiesterase class II)
MSTRMRFSSPIATKVRLRLPFVTLSVEGTCYIKALISGGGQGLALAYVVIPPLNSEHGDIMRWNLKRALWGNAHMIAEDVDRSLGDEKSEFAMLQSLIAAYDRQTRDHVQRTARLARSVACRLYFSEEEMHRLYLAALLHDIGKIRIPKAILYKRGALDEREQGILRLHPETGSRILLQAGDAFGDLAAIVAAHHEQWDGRGYPLGLAGEEIPRAARIVAVADAFDAMTSRRPYQRPLSFSEARLEIQRCAGNRYDALVVSAFLAVLDECHAYSTRRARPLFTVPGLPGGRLRRNPAPGEAGSAGAALAAP